MQRKTPALEHAKHGSTYATIQQDRREKEAIQQRIKDQQRQELMAAQEPANEQLDDEEQVYEQDDSGDESFVSSESSSDVPAKAGAKRKSDTVEDKAQTDAEDLKHVSQEMRSRAFRMASQATPGGSVTTQPGKLDVYEELVTMKYLKYILLNKRDYPAKFKESDYVADIDGYIIRLESLRDFFMNHAGPEPAKRARVSSSASKKKDSRDELPAEPMTVDDVVRAAKPHLTFMMKIKTEDIADINQAHSFVSQLRSRLKQDDTHSSNGGYYVSSFLESVEEYHKMLTSLQAYHHKVDSDSAYDERLKVTVKRDDEDAAQYKTSGPLAKVDEVFREVSKTRDLRRLEVIQELVYEHVYDHGGVE
ncbi:hypothetical protein M409DRAFT_21951 [Zasmidium cellare ATCC 36951]|uniref:Uncharacterized protein n=1 Tax=Zasmidium cellare ATCC 36951 TaxID=1080233 RepID=A0A6A6CPL8_ZASCE|nr:uncharacterized protein M409DRAFT_21951 [Zasmidium cellare ATCC 36951]KAF2167802.1 hypothetical protein M409DRAFT_21951 [Zasmidium cellare ATCC 36951]